MYIECWTGRLIIHIICTTQEINSRSTSIFPQTNVLISSYFIEKEVNVGSHQ